MPTSEMKISTSAERGEGRGEKGEGRGERGEGRGERGEGRGERGEGRGERGEGRGEREVWCCCTLHVTFQVLHQPHQFLLFVREVRGKETLHLEFLLLGLKS